MNWINLESLEQLDKISTREQDALIFKHSTRCPTSSMAKRILTADSSTIPEGVHFYFLDLIAYREISNQIAAKWQVRHESPQLLAVKGNTCVYHASHSDISMEEALASFADY